MEKNKKTRTKKLPSKRKDLKDDYLNYEFRNARTLLNLSMEEISQQTGINIQTLYGYERLRSKIPEENAGKIADALGKSIMELFPVNLDQITKEIQAERKKEKQQSITQSMEEIDQTQLTYQENIEEILDEKFIREGIIKQLKILPEEEQEILELRYGLTDGNIYTVSEIAEAYQMSENRVRTLEHRALRKLQHPDITEKLKEYIT